MTLLKKKKSIFFYFNPHFPLNNKLPIPLQTDEVPILQATHCSRLVSQISKWEREAAVPGWL